MIDKATSRRIRVEIRHVLLGVWDPIGVRDEPNAQDEYDGYIGEIFALLSGGTTDEQLSDRLLYFVNDRMGLSATPEAMLPTIRALRAIEFPEVISRPRTPYLIAGRRSIPLPTLRSTFPSSRRK